VLSGLVNQHFFDLTFVNQASAERIEGEGVLSLDLRARIILIPTGVRISTSSGPL